MKTEKKPGKILDILNKTPVYILTSFLICILPISLFSHAEFCIYKFGDKPAWLKEDCVSLIIYITILLFAYIMIYKLVNKFDKLNRRQVIFTILYLSVILQVLVILYLPANQFADQNIVNQIAMRIINGNFIDFQTKEYLYSYPNNIGISVFLSVIYRVFPNTLLVPKLLNVVLSTFTSLLIFRIYEETEHTESNKGYGILVFSGFFLPMLLLNNLVYNDIIATTLFLGAAYHTIMFVKTKKWPHLALVGVFIISGDFFRQVGIIFLIAAALYFIINKIRIFKTIVFFGIVFVLCRLPLFLINGYLIHTEKITEPIGRNSAPIHMWVNMGMNEESMGYWDNSFSYNIYAEDGAFNKAKSMKIYTEMIKSNIEENGLLGVATVYLKKNIWLWTEGTYQAEYYGIGSWGYLYETFFTKLADDNFVLRNQTRYLFHALNLLRLGLILVGLAWSVIKKRAYSLVMPAIVLLGFICFYTIWEIKPRYIYITYPYLILMSYHGLAIIAEKFPRKKRRL